jgi:hypothetical protein
MFYKDWHNEEFDLFRIANTARNESYLTQTEKDVFLYLNFARINPSLFAKTYLAYYNGVEGMEKGYAFDERKRSLIGELIKLEPLDMLFPDSVIFEHARCFAIEAGEQGIIGHERDSVTCQNSFQECCTYKLDDGLDIVMGLLIDAGEQNEDLEHRKTCLNQFGLMGVSIQPHSTKRVNAVLNFGFMPENIYECTLFDGVIYKGTRDIMGNFDGVGMLVQDDGYQYQGYWKKNKMHGKGVLKMSNGSKYEGEWKDNKMHGRGIYYQSDGSWYNGEWRNGEIHGDVIFKTRFGSEYHGAFKNGKQTKKWMLVTDRKEAKNSDKEDKDKKNKKKDENKNS